MRERLCWQLRLFLKIPADKGALVLLILLPVFCLFFSQVGYEPDVLYGGEIISNSEYEARKEAWQSGIASRIDSRWVAQRKEDLEAARKSLRAEDQTEGSDQKIRMMEDAYYDGVFALKEKAAADFGDLPGRIRTAFYQNSWNYGPERISKQWMMALCSLGLISFLVWSTLCSMLANQEDGWNGAELIDCAQERRSRSIERLIFGSLLVAAVTFWQIFILLAGGRLLFGAFPADIMVLYTRSLQPYSWHSLFMQGLQLMIIAQFFALFCGFIFSLLIKKTLFSLLAAMTFQLMPFFLSSFVPQSVQVFFEFFPISYLMFFSPGQLMMSAYVLAGSMVFLKTEWAAIALGAAVIGCLFSVFIVLRRKNYA